MKQEQEDAAQTVAYSAEEIRALRDTLRGKDEAAEEEGTSKTMAYMEAVKPAAPAEPGEGSAPTVAYMEAITPGKGSETIAYSPEDRARVLETMGMKGFGQEDAAGATQAYSGDEMKKMREAYDLLKKAKTAPVPTFTPDMATQPGTQPVSPEAGKEQPPAGPAAREAPALAPKSPRLSPMPDRTVPAGRSAAARAAVIAGLLVACAAVTALLLHLLGIVHLPIPLPSLF
jgi:hypothetical protein